MSNLLNLSKAYGNKLNLLNTIKGLNLNVSKMESKGNASSFLNVMSSESKKLAKAKFMIFDFLNFFKDNGLIAKNLKKSPLNKSFFLKKLENEDFVSDLKSLIARMNVFLDFEGLNSIKEDLSSNFDFLGKEKFFEKIEKLCLAFNDLSSFLGFNFLTDLIDDYYNQISLNDKKEEKNVINIDVKNFKKNNSDHNDFVFSRFSLNAIDGQNFVDRYKVKEISNDSLKGFVEEFANYNIKSSKDVGGFDFVSSLKPEWNLKINKNIVDKAKVVLKSNNTGEIKLVLKPKELGSIRINLNLDSNNNLLGKIVVDNQNVKMLFDQNMHSLNKMLGESGFNASLNLFLAGENLNSFTGDFKDDSKDQNLHFGYNKFFKIEEEVEFSYDVDKNVNLIV
ncbi:flagellar hook-length control protein FliK [Borreliella burgdorferi]|uniref:flagellar hook-length control protein FliK n=1 Tax=Borreliella burgdorferi TaxID=139 RepID=UPI00017F328A|nr:flagellar hook-length control protein FliK [Borreliella burgdorferi]ATH09849.1 flagellar hook-length control protein FliK [Borreliella burgdorferi]EEF82266.1 flagellar protein [Borreliella burgdorferi WI91-23]MCD2417846.1 flagellar hook-length control protein FliK [Borreliella burgdorferi]MCD2419922.1 flagellar hook-length control protein FliK [Borreliella burgdorferi]PRQ95488.1 flagellar hook-length control protein FliK [Borreliella burgdorferi]